MTHLEFLRNILLMVAATSIAVVIAILAIRLLITPVGQDSTYRTPVSLSPSATATQSVEDSATSSA